MLNRRGNSLYRPNKTTDKEGSQAKGPQLTAQDIMYQIAASNKNKTPQKTFFFNDQRNGDPKKQAVLPGYPFNKPKLVKKYKPSPIKTPEPVMHEYSSPSRVKKVFSNLLADGSPLVNTVIKQPSIDSLRKSASLHRAVVGQVTPGRQGTSICNNPIERLLQERYGNVRTNRSMSKFLTQEEFSCRSGKQLAKSYDQNTLQDRLKHIIHTNPAVLQHSLRRNIEEKLRDDRQNVPYSYTAKKSGPAKHIARNVFWSGQKRMSIGHTSPVKKVKPGVKVSAFEEEISQISHNIFKSTPKDRSNRSISLLKELGSISIEDHTEKKSKSNQPDTGLNTYSFCLEQS